MSKIKLLDEELITQIAAGEVIERPSSVVKELLENSLDAGSTRIIIRIKDSGKKLISIQDNGQGMDEEDAKKSILRHATSKISSAEDLFAIQTLGFRGEALATIAAVSQLSIITKTKDLLEGFNLVIEGGKIISTGVMAAETGTTIEVCNLFFNVPVRKKFLRTDAVELRHIIDVVTNYALLNPHVSIKLYHDNHALLDTPNSEDSRQSIASIYGLNIAKELLEVSSQNENIIIKGFIGKPLQSRNDKNLQVIFVNNRLVKNSDIADAVSQGYHSMLFHGKYPIFFLKIILDPSKIDVNIHPQKSEIKIEQKEELGLAISLAVKETLHKNNLVPIMELDDSFNNGFNSFSLNSSSKNQTKYRFDSSAQTTLDLEETSETNLPQQSVIEQDSIEQLSQPDQKGKDSIIGTTYQPSYSQNKQITPKLPEMKLFGQIHKTFFIAETDGGILFIDQHATHERVMYEKFMKQLLTDSVEIQQLLQGEVIECSIGEKIMIEEYLKDLKQFGFLLEPFGGNSFILKTLPSVFGRLQPATALRELLSSIDDKNSLIQKKEEIITRMACRAAVMAGDVLTNTWMENILCELEETDHPFTCPHGRPGIIKITADELEKKFKRKG
ncbi:MAG: DNA mismatch repair endonuclease MutL [archaeon]|nr:DNA mismatch repair endonuclease MutL [archaeon]